MTKVSRRGVGFLPPVLLHFPFLHLRKRVQAPFSSHHRKVLPMSDQKKPAEAAPAPASGPADAAPAPAPEKASRRLVFAVDQKMPDGAVITTLVYAKGRGGALKHCSAPVFTARRPSPTEVADRLTAGARIETAAD